MEKKLTNSGPLREPADKHSIYTIEINSIIESVQPLREPRGQTVRRHGLSQLGRGDQLPRALTPSQGLTELMGDCRSGLQNGREVVLGELVDRGGQQRANLGGGRSARQHPELAEMVTRPEPEQFDL